jgi:hypothetical protein
MWAESIEIAPSVNVNLDFTHPDLFKVRRYATRKANIIWSDFESLGRRIVTSRKCVEWFLAVMAEH